MLFGHKEERRADTFTTTRTDPENTDGSGDAPSLPPPAGLHSDEAQTGGHVGSAGRQVAARGWGAGDGGRLLVHVGVPF